MSVGLFISCYVDQFFPNVARATLTILERLGIDVVFPSEQTCCGQPFANSGFVDEAERLARRLVETFEGCEHVVSPSGSCVSMIRNHSHGAFASSERLSARASSFYELSEYLCDVVGASFRGEFRRRVALHQSCHGLRELRLGSSSERMERRPEKIRSLLSGIAGLELVELQRSDECCGFGGTFAVSEEAVSVRMGQDRLADHLGAGAEVVAAADMSCLMHLQGLSRRAGYGLRFMHFAEILAEAAEA